MAGTKITIKDTAGNTRYSFGSFPEGSTGKYSLGKEDYILIPFSAAEPVGFRLGDYADLSGAMGEAQGGKFAKVYEVTELPKPTYNTSTGGYDYELKMEAYYRKWKNKIFKYTPENGGQEASWNLTATLDVHLGVFIRNLKALGYKFKGQQFAFTIDTTVEDAAKLVSYDNTNLLDALTAMAEAWECEWWVEENQIRFGRCESGDAVDIEIGVEASEMSRSESSGTYATRVYAFGSERNIASNYRPADNAAAVNGVVQRRLMLPSGTPYIDAYRYKDGARVYIGEDGYGGGTEMPTEEAIEDVAVFDDVYPRTQCVVGTVASYDSTTEDEDTGESSTQTFYYVTDTSSFAFDESYILSGEELRMVFQSGNLNGMDFGVTFRKKGSTLAGTVLANDVYEIVANDDYGRSLPDDTLKPAAGDKFILYNWDSSKLAGSGLIEKAEAELLEKATAYVKKTMVDDGTYNVTLASSWVYADETNRTFDIGQRINLINKSFFEDGRTSRVVGFETKLDFPFDSPQYSVGESTEYSRVGELEDKVDELAYKGQAYAGGGGSGVYVVRTNDSTAASNSNVYSALRSRDEFISRKRNDRAKGLVVFEQGIHTGTEGNATVDGKGNAELLSLVVRSLLRSPVFTSGMSGEGWKLWLDGSGLANLEVDKLTVRQTMDVFELLTGKIRSVGGRVIVSASDGKISTVSESGGNYVLGIEPENTFQAGDLVRCQTFTGGQRKSYWAEVSSSAGNYITVAKSEFGGYIPETGDELVLMGSTSDTSRQNLISISATEDGQPRIDVLDGVSSKSTSGALRARLGNLDGINDSWFPADGQPQGNGLYADNAYLKGKFLLSTGEDVKTKFEVVEGRLESSVEGLREDMAGNTGSYLENPCFLDGMEHWTATGDTSILSIGGTSIWANGSILAAKGDGTSLYTDGGRNVARIKASSITQENADFRTLPETSTNSDGEKEAVAVYLSFYYKCITPGTLSVTFEGVDKTGYNYFETMDVSAELDATDGYVQFTCSGMWNGTGGFKLSFTGEAYFYMLVLSEDEADTLAYKYRTLFEQSAALVKIAAENFDADGNVLESSQIITTSKYNALLSEKFNTDGTLKNTAGLVTAADFTGWQEGTYASDLSKKMDTESFSSMFAEAVEADTGIVKRAEVSAFVTKDDDGKLESGVYVEADQIKLEGLVTVNSNFKVLEDGSIEATNGKFSGTLDGVTGSFKTLAALNDSGSQVASIGFNASNESGSLTFETANGAGKFWFTGDIYHQGANKEDGNRSLRFYSSDIFCRGSFSSRYLSYAEFTFSRSASSGQILLCGSGTVKSDFYNPVTADVAYQVDESPVADYKNLIFIDTKYRDADVYVGGMATGRVLVIVNTSSYNLNIRVDSPYTFTLPSGRGGIFVVKGHWASSYTGGKTCANNVLYTIDP